MNPTSLRLASSSASNDIPAPADQAAQRSHDHHQLAALVLEQFVERRDVFAHQRDDGTYIPVRRPLTASTIADHISGKTTVGHYMPSQEGTARVLVFDIDLTRSGYWVSLEE